MKIFNASNMLGTLSFLILFIIPAAVEGGMYITAVFLTIAMAICARLSIKEEGKGGDRHDL